MKGPLSLGFDDEDHPRWAALLRRVTLALLLVTFCAVVARPWIEDRPLADVLLLLHRSAGLALLMISLLRVMTTPARALRRAIGASNRSAVGLIAHLTVYALLVGVPLLGWALSSARGEASLFLGAIPLPALTPDNRMLALALQPLHLFAALLLIAALAIYAFTQGWLRGAFRATRLGHRR